MCDCMTAAASAADPCRFESLECSSTVPYWLTKSVEGTGRRVPVGGAVGVLGGLGLEWELWVAQGGGGIGQQAGRAGEGPDKGWTLRSRKGKGFRVGCACRWTLWESRECACMVDADSAASGVVPQLSVLWALRALRGLWGDRAQRRKACRHTTRNGETQLLGAAPQWGS